MNAPSASAVPNRWLVLVMVCIAQFMVVLDGTVVNVALPHIASSLSFAPDDLPWVINAYTLVFGGFLLLGGRAADIIGRKRLFLAGVVVFTVASVACGLARNSEMLLVARALQGLGAAMVSPAALSIVTTTFRDPGERAKALSVWAAIAVGGSAVGLLVGGVLTEALSWEWIFFINAPIGLATLILSMRLVPESRMERRGGVDIAGAVSVTAGVGLLVYGIVKAETYGWGSIETWSLLGGAVAVLALFVAIERTVKVPLVRLGIFRTRHLTGANLVMLAAMGGLFGTFFFTSIYIQDVLGFTAIQTGLAFLPMTIMIIVFSVVAQRLLARVSARDLGIAGMTISAIGLLLLTRIQPDGSYWTQLLPGILVIAAGLGLTFVPLTLIATSGVRDDDAGLASGLFNTSQQVGGALGLAVLATVANSFTADALAGAGAGPDPAVQATALVEGYQRGFVAGAGLMIVGAIALLLIIRKRDMAAINVVEAPAPVHV
ncbi:MAG: MFS transporter [Miltoncostaeaceae bacterium]